MKKILWSTLALVMVVVLTSCGGRESGGGQMVYKDKNKLPSLMAVSDGSYYILTCMYGDDQYRLSVSDKVEELNFVYDVKDASIWYLYAEGDYAAWVERYDDRYEYKVYDKGTNEVLSIDIVKCSEEEQQNMQMGIYGGKLYYSTIDYTGENISLKRYDIRGKKTEIVREAALPENISTALEVKDGVMTAYLEEDRLCCIDLKSGEETSVKIPGEMDSVYAVSYDRETGLYALYYSEKGSETEDIGTFIPGDRRIKSIYTLRGSVYAYRDAITVDKGHLFWVTQINASGNIVDHYTLADYSCKEDKVEEYPGTFGFALTGDALYKLSFVDNIDRIGLEKMER